jgi:hypothetical protein
MLCVHVCYSAADGREIAAVLHERSRSVTPHTAPGRCALRHRGRSEPSRRWRRSESLAGQ